MARRNKSDSALKIATPKALPPAGEVQFCLAPKAA